MRKEAAREREAELDRAHQLQLLQYQTMAHYPNTSPSRNHAHYHSQKSPHHNSQKSPHHNSPLSLADQYSNAMKLLQTDTVTHTVQTTPQRHPNNMLFGAPHPSEALYKKALSNLEAEDIHENVTYPETDTFIDVTQ